MNFTPFPPDIAKASAERTAARWNATKKRKPASHSDPDCCCYQLPDGQIRPVYDPYKPCYPEGSVPGFGTVHAVLNYYPNDSQGYEYHVTDFKPLPTKP